MARRSNRKHRIGGRLTAIVGAAALAALAVTPTAAAATPTAATVTPTAAAADAPPSAPAYPVIASGLDNPRQLSFDSDGNLYVAESGHGGDGACIPSADTPGVDTCFGTSGAITEVTPSGQHQVVTGLPSLAPQVATQDGQLPPGAEAAGPSDVQVLANGDLGFTVGLGSDPANRTTLAESADAAAGLGMLDGFDGDSVTNVADIAQFEADNNPVPPADTPDSNPNSLFADEQGTFVVDAGGNDLLQVDAEGNVSLVATFPSVTTTCPPPGAPAGTPPMTAQAVPTSVVRGSDGDLYVSELTGFPFCEGAASVYRVHIPTEGAATATVFASGLTNVTDLAFGADGTLYAVEIAQHGLLQGPIGSVVAIPSGGGASFSDYQVVAAGLFAPYGIALKGGFAYVTTGSILPATAGGGQVLAIPTGCGFSDVPANSTFRTDICAMAAAGFIQGYTDGTFRPDQAVSRQAFAAFLGRMHGFTGQCGSSFFPLHSRFPDVPDSSQFCVAINALALEGVIQGYPDGNFQPVRAVSRQAVAAYLWRDTQVQQHGQLSSSDAPPTATDFPDVPASNIFSGDIQFGADNGLINGYVDGQFKPTAPTSRQAAAAFLYRLGQLEAGPGFPATGMIPRPE